MKYQKEKRKKNKLFFLGNFREATSPWDVNVLLKSITHPNDDDREAHPPSI